MKNGIASANNQTNTVNDSFSKQMHKKITKGLKLSFKKLVAEKRKKNSSLAFVENGKIVVIKAKDIKL
jgi:hypothetical protein